MTRRSLALVALAISLGASACGSDSRPRDAHVDRDATSGADDAGPSEADAATSDDDAATIDASVSVDAAAAASDAGAGLTAEGEYLVTVRTPDWNTPTGTLRRYRREGGAWTADGAAISIILGRNGLAWGRGLHGEGALAGLGGTEKREGDGRSPAGLFRMAHAYGYAADAPSGTSISYTSMTPTLQCIEDTASAYYNQVVDRAVITPDWTSTDRLRRMDGLYEFIVFVEHNTGPAVAGRGSCILLHVWSNEGATPTAGCTSMARSDLETVVRSLHAEGNLLVQLPESAYLELADRWQLPTNQ